MKKVSARALILNVPKDTVNVRSGFRWFTMSQWTSRSGACSESVCLDYMPGGTGYSGMFRWHAI